MRACDRRRQAQTFPNTLMDGATITSAPLCGPEVDKAQRPA